jgi:hypothetical protein
MGGRMLFQDSESGSIHEEAQESVVLNVSLLQGMHEASETGPLLSQLGSCGDSNGGVSVALTDGQWEVKMQKVKKHS